ncbi:hypothetical protein [Qipengyuania gaetbuli]|uniref:hypothetical protein n=1 Tax=Qipengyuania gaetbuli TaxID=266952 RepID=UPI001CFF37A7|nr:hypothetical protein [Qipengyuania gaetbuli]
MLPTGFQAQKARKSRPPNNGVKWPSVQGALLLFGCLTIYVSVYLRDAIGPSLTNVDATLLLASGVVAILISGAARFSNYDVIVAFTFGILALINTSMAGGFAFSNYLIAPIIGLIISRSSRSMFMSFMIVHAIVSVVLQAYEQVIGAYIFEVVAADGSILDNTHFAGHAGVMRAKGLFQGPLSAVAFYILFALLSPKTLNIGLGTIGAVLAYGRLGIILMFSLFIARIFSAAGSIRRFLIILVAAIFLYLAPQIMSLPSFFTAAFDLASSGNSARIYFWQENLSHYLNYSAANAAFGNLGYANRVIGSTESDFLRILMDAGFLSLFAYLIFLIGAFAKAKKIGYEKSFHFLVIGVAMAVFPFIQSLNAAILFWIFIWGFFHGHEGLRQ